MSARGLAQRAGVSRSAIKQAADRWGNKKTPSLVWLGVKCAVTRDGCLEGITGIRGKRGPACERGGRAYRTKPFSIPKLCSKDTVFKNFCFCGDLQIIQRDSCKFVIATFPCPQFRKRSGILPFIQLALDFRCVIVNREMFKASQPGPQIRQAAAVQPINPARADGLVCHQTRLFENFEVLGDRRPADREPRRQHCHRSRPLTQPIEQQSAGSVPESIENIMVRHYLP